MRPTNIECKEVEGKTVKALYITAEENEQAVEIEFTDGTALGIDVRPAVQFRVDIANVRSGDRIVQKKIPHIVGSSLVRFPCRCQVSGNANATYGICHWSSNEKTRTPLWMWWIRRRYVGAAGH